MSAINYPPFILSPPVRPPARPRPRSLARVETLAVAAGICLSVPLRAATGLSVWLPHVVARIAAALVPWAEPVEAEPIAFRGEIVPTAAELTPAAVVPPVRSEGLPTSTARSTQSATPTRPAARALAPPGAEPSAPRTTPTPANDAPARSPAAEPPPTTARAEEAASPAWPAQMATTPPDAPTGSTSTSPST